MASAVRMGGVDAAVDDTRSLRFAGRRRPMSEAALVRAAQAGSERAVEELFARHWDDAYRAALLVTHDRAAAEDIAQEAFLAALRALPTLRPPPPAAAVAAPHRRQPRDRLRARPRAARARSAPSAAPEARRAPRRARSPGSARSAPAIAGAGRPSSARSIVLRYLLELTPGEIAGALDLPRGTVNSRLRRGLDALARRSWAVTRGERRCATSCARRRRATDPGARDPAALRRGRAAAGRYARPTGRRGRGAGAALVHPPARAPRCAGRGGGLVRSPRRRLAAPRGDVGALGARASSAPGERGARPALVRAARAAAGCSSAGGRRARGSCSADGSRAAARAPTTGASWSPHGRFVVAWRGGELAALEPRRHACGWSLVRVARAGSPRPAGRPWTASASPTSPAAALRGRQRATATGDRRLAAARPAAPRPGGPDADHVLAYADQHAAACASSRSTAGASSGARGRSRDGRDRARRGRPTAPRLAGRRPSRSVRALGRSGAQRSPPRSTRRSGRPPASWPTTSRGPRDGRRLAVVRRERACAAKSSWSARAAARGRCSRGSRPARRAWRCSPDGRRLLVPWPAADRWILIGARRTVDRAGDPPVPRVPARRRAVLSLQPVDPPMTRGRLGAVGADQR